MCTRHVRIALSALLLGLLPALVGMISIFAILGSGRNGNGILASRSALACTSLHDDSSGLRQSRDAFGTRTTTLHADTNLDRDWYRNSDSSGPSQLSSRQNSLATPRMTWSNTPTPTDMVFDWPRLRQPLGAFVPCTNHRVHRVTDRLCVGDDRRCFARPPQHRELAVQVRFSVRSAIHADAYLDRNQHGDSDSSVLSQVDRRQNSLATPRMTWRSIPTSTILNWLRMRQSPNAFVTGTNRDYHSGPVAPPTDHHADAHDADAHAHADADRNQHADSSSSALSQVNRRQNSLETPTRMTWRNTPAVETATSCSPTDARNVHAGTVAEGDPLSGKSAVVLLTDGEPDLDPALAQAVNAGSRRFILSTRQGGSWFQFLFGGPLDTRMDPLDWTLREREETHQSAANILKTISLGRDCFAACMSSLQRPDSVIRASVVSPSTSCLLDT